MLEDQIANKLFKKDSERTFIDKVLAKEDVNAIRELIKKPKLKREDLLELLYLIVGTEAKLLNFGAWDRYIILKYFVWVREFVKVAELSYDYEDDLKKQHQKGKIKLSSRTKKLLYNNQRLIEHNAKFLIDLYFNIARTTLSLGATGLIKLLETRFEMVYSQPGQTDQPRQQMGGLLKAK